MKKFSEYFEVSSKNGLSKSFVDDNDGIKIVNMKELFGYNPITDNVSMRKVQLTDSEINRFQLKNGDLLFGRRSLVAEGAGKTTIFKGKTPTVFESSIIRVRLNKEKADYDFANYYFNSPVGRGIVLSIVTGAAVFGIRGSDLQNIVVDFPNLPTQKKIASILSAYDDLIENNNQRIQLLEEMAEEIYKEWFVRLRFPGYQDHKFFDKNGKEVPPGTVGALPAGWENVKLGEICEIKMGQSPKSKFYNAENVGLPFHQGVTNFQDRFPIHKMYCSDLKRIANDSDVLLSVRAPVGRINIANTKLIIGRGLSSIRHTNKRQNYLLYLLKDVFKHEDSFGNGAVFNAVSKNDLVRIVVMKSTEDIESEFQELIKPIDDEIKVLTEKNQILQETRDLLLPRLISGKLSVADIELENNTITTMAAEPEKVYEN